MPEEVNNPVMDNLSASEDKLQEVNKQLDSLVSEYHEISGTVGESSFFNFDNMYFWLVLVGLILLAFGLWFLMTELKYYSPKRKVKKVSGISSEPATIKSVIKQETKKKKTKKTKTAKKKKPVKIKVVKVK